MLHNLSNSSKLFKDQATNLHFQEKLSELHFKFCNIMLLQYFYLIVNIILYTFTFAKFSSLKVGCLSQVSETTNKLGQ